MLLRRYPTPVILVALFVSTLRAEDSEADALREKGVAALKDSQSHPRAIVDAARAFVKAEAMYVQVGNDEKSVEMNSFLYWCKKKMTMEDIEAFTKGGEAAVSMKLADVEKTAPAADDAQKWFDRADQFSTKNPSEHLLIAIRFFEVADRFKGTDASLKAQDRSLKEITLVSSTQQAPAAPERLNPEAPKKQGKVSAPSLAQQKEAEKRIRDLFKAEFAKTLSADKLAFATTLETNARDTRDDPVARYVLILLAANVNAQMARFNAVLSDLEMITSEYEGNTNTPLRTVLTLAASNTHNFELTKVAEAYNTLLDKPDDAGANDVVGKYECFSRNNFVQGLAKLAKSKNAALAKLAQEDAANSDNTDPLSFGNRWWELAQKTSDKAEKLGWQKRAVLWYDKALPTLAGLSKASIEKHLAEFAAAEMLAHPETAPVDMIKNIKIPHDVIAGKWTLVDGGLSVERGSGRSRLQLWPRPPEEYDVRFSFIKKAGNDSIGLILVFNENAVHLCFGGYGNTLAGLQKFNGQYIANNVTRTDFSIDEGRLYAVLAQVRHDSIRVEVNKKELFVYHSNHETITIDGEWKMRDSHNIGIFCEPMAVDFKSIELIPVAKPQQ